MADTDVGWAHAQGLADLLEPLPYRVFIGQVDEVDGPLEYPHLILWPPPAMRPTITLNGYGGETATTTQITAVGRDPREAITALDRASALLHRRRPTIPGRNCSVITQQPEAAGPPQPQRDEQARTPDGHPPYFTFALFTLNSSRSPDG